VKKILNLAVETVEHELAALALMRERMDHSVAEAVELMSSMHGRLVILGMGKSGIVGKKIASTFASTGTPSYFVHPGEAFHGDLGMIQSVDIAMLISNSGETEEILRILPFLKDQKNKIIALTGKKNSTLAKYADVVLDVGVDREACSNNLAPTSSTTCTLVMGDALAVTLSKIKDFKPDDFARLHPGGNLGRKILGRVSDFMFKNELPMCSQNDSFRSVIREITSGKLGLVLVIDDGHLVGIITDGDIRRAFERYDDCRSLFAKDLMTTCPVHVSPDFRVMEAEKLMQDKKINSLVVTQHDLVCGVYNIHSGR
jgi:arabinose-5-phosphate isomerase